MGILVCQEPNVWAFNVLEDFSSHELLEIPIFLKDICKKRLLPPKLRNQQPENLKPGISHLCSEGPAIILLHHSQLEAPKFFDMRC